jgi:hypothetical protein
MPSSLKISSRRSFLRLLVVGATVGSCRRESPPADPCMDIRDLSDADRQTRYATNYVAHTAFPDQRCDTCQFWLPPTSPSPCGGCVVVKGPIHPNGHCTSWAPVENVAH